MTTQIESRVKSVVAMQMGIAEADLKPETNFVNNLGDDSLDEIELVMALEDEFGIQIDDERAEQVKTVQQAIDFITRELQPA